jgi:hypothetical protein
MVDFLHQMRVEGEAAAPELGAGRGLDERVVEDHAGEDRTDREHAQWHQHRPWALMRMVAGRALGLVLRPGNLRMRVIARMLLRRVVLVMPGPMRVVDGMLDMLGRGPAGLAEEGEEDEPPGIEAVKQRGEQADRESKAAGAGPAI